MFRNTSTDGKILNINITEDVGQSQGIDLMDISHRELSSHLAAVARLIDIVGLKSNGYYPPRVHDSVKEPVSVNLPIDLNTRLLIEDSSVSFNGHGNISISDSRISLDADITDLNQRYIDIENRVRRIEEALIPIMQRFIGMTITDETIEEIRRTLNTHFSGV